MKCGYSPEILALLVESDLPDSASTDRARAHVAQCSECRRYCSELESNQALLKSRFQSSCRTPVPSEVLREMRRAVMDQIESADPKLGWAVRIERFVLKGMRRQRYALAGFAFAAIVSASLLGQITHSKQETGASAAVFVGKNVLARPVYREWVFVGSTLGLGYSQTQAGGEMYHNVYIDPASYREYSKSGKLPEGTVMVLEAASAEAKSEPGLQGSYQKDFVALEASVKDSSRFDGGWGFFNFTDGTGGLKTQAEVLPQSAGCLSCHRQKAATDHVFTQFYPVMKPGKSAEL